MNTDEKIFYTIFGIAVVLLFIAPIGVSVSMWNHQDDQIVSYVPYTGDHGVQYRIFTVQTPSGLTRITVQCTYYDSATTLPIMDHPFWYYGYVWHSYAIDPPAGVAGCL